MHRDELQRRLDGPIASIVTPFDQGGQIFPEGLKREVQFLLASGIRAFVCCGSIGEFSSLTVSERKQMLELTVDIVRDKALIVAGCASSDVETVLELSDHAAAKGAHGIMLTAPYYFKSRVEEIW